ncbi:ANR family transcriptional regulator [Serratia fonticola]|uniref:ANR family transcriptional regulator n=1 Tax=Serratia fonticola TaxID=47917 RepID=UPI0027E78F31|nr:ANR family transcriptional regulator [Serratia fonticola]MDQ7209428.1 ANR family transcriptional regulator [Serratia fonticola]HBE9082237.1 ANR family transcriptional regulator [Serratia fonticola]HBE9092727.1 ANR family transcriptional regulator [Serratia fonticola]
MKLGPYMLNANQAVKFEKADQLQLASTFWRQASAVAVKEVNRDWADVRADRCDKRRTLAVRHEAARQKAIAEKEAKRTAETLGSHINKTTSGEASA